MLKFLLFCYYNTHYSDLLWFGCVGLVTMKILHWIERPKKRRVVITSVNGVPKP